MFQAENDSELISTFYAQGLLCGVNTNVVQEVVAVSNITPVHHASDYISGIINLRGQIVTVIDLARRLKMQAENAPPGEYILIIASQGEHIGLLVDSVSDVIPIDLSDLIPPPANISAYQKQFIKGFSQVDNRPMAILNTAAILDDERDEN